MDSIFNLVIVLVPIAIIIGRLVAQVKSKHAPPKPQPRIQVHFEDDDDYHGPKASQAYALSTAASSQDLPLKPTEMIPTKNKAPAPRALPKPAYKGQEGFLPGLNRLSPMKQAVVMAEVLGPPKALRE